jgi:APA family basic amino acid/polyamine antiporter
MGEWPAFLAAICLSLEYIAAGAAVSRSWGDKLAWWLLEAFPESWEPSLKTLFNVDGNISPLAFCISTACVTLILRGVKESKRATNVITFIKVSLVMFMIIAGSFHVRPSNWRPMFPFGASGMLRGATSTFLGKFDEESTPYFF